MTDTRPLDLALVLAKLKRLYSGDAGIEAMTELRALIALLEPHAPKPRDEWMEGFRVLLRHNGVADIIAYVQAERDRLEEMWKKK